MSQAWPSVAWSRKRQHGGGCSWGATAVEGEEVVAHVVEGRTEDGGGAQSKLENNHTTLRKDRDDMLKSGGAGRMEGGGAGRRSDEIWGDGVCAAGPHDGGGWGWWVRDGRDGETRRRRRREVLQGCGRGRGASGDVRLVFAMALVAL